jgi:hypothetical protein
MASSMPESAAEKQPGKSGTTTPQAVVALPGSMAMGYFMWVNLVALEQSDKFLAFHP